MEDKEELLININEAIKEVSEVKKVSKIKSLSVYDPDKVAKIIYLHSIGVSQTQMIRKYGLARTTILNVLVDYADHFGQLKELAGKLSAKNYMNISSLEEDLIEKVRDRMEVDPEFEVSFRDLKELSIAKANAFREAMTSRGEASKITEDRQVVTQDDYEATIKAAKARLDSIKKADIIDL
jgi:transglutaminase/protease-like cytokinesis protein 3